MRFSLFSAVSLSSMFKQFIVSFFILTLHFGSIGQLDTMSTNSVFLEAGGYGGYGSINYERGFFRFKKFTISASVGISTMKIMDYRDKINPNLIIPIAAHICYGFRHKAEIGFGNTFINEVRYGTIDTPKRISVNHGNMHIGYRFQKDEGGVLFRIGYTPLLENYATIRHWAGISIGYTFKT
jgi:hypothetical protein